MTTVGYGDTFPVEPAGKLVASLAMVCGVVVLALPISVIGNNFSNAYEDNQSALRRAANALKETRAAEGFVALSDEQALVAAGLEIQGHAAELRRLTDQIGGLLLLKGKGPAARAVQMQFQHQRETMKTAVDNLVDVAMNADVHSVALGHDANDAQDPTLA